ncbi:MAG: hypothetical protein JWL72_3219 [Ilumatobacteraceae bacterium]|nr:hypothetical protein [Ilumatobacteraceae bacterium]
MRSFRWVHVAMVLAMAAAAATSLGLVQAATASGEGAVSSFVPIVPCRLLDTRPDTAVGTRNSPLLGGETVTLAVWGTNGSCTIPSSATAMVGNVTAVGATQASYLALYPADAAQPTTSNLNPTPGQPPIPNQVTTGISATGSINLFNFAGSVDVIVDIVGYYTPAGAGGPGPKGDTGAQGPKGDTGGQGQPGTPAVNPARIVWVATNGTHPAAAGGSVAIFASVREALASIKDNSSTAPYVIKIAPGTYTDTTSMTMKPYVDLEGSGEDTTILKCMCSNLDFYTGAVHIGANTPMQIRSLAVLIVSTSGAVGIEIESAATSPVSLVHVSVTASSSGSGYYASVAGINVALNAWANLDSVTTVGTGGLTPSGLYVNNHSEVMAVNLTATASGSGTPGYGVWLFEGNAAIDGSRLQGSTYSVKLDQSSNIRLSNTRLNGPINGTGASCFNTFTILYGFYNANCTNP